jgi:predicted dehydrogenase
MNTHPPLSRRKILKGAAAVGALGPFFSGRVLGANDRVTMAIIGTRGQGSSHIAGFGKHPNVRIKTLCDIDENLWAAKVKRVEAANKNTPGTVYDMRRVFDDKDIDAVSVAIPNVWHALATIWACQAGKNVYVEKPACHSIWEGRQMVNAARKHGVAVQVGFQNRSRKNTVAAMKFLHEGKLGKVYLARGLCFKRRYDIGRFPDGPQPAGSRPVPVMGGTLGPYTQSYLDKVHYDLWIGPAPAHPFNPNRFHYNWHWFWDSGNGDTGNQGPHQFDVGRWGLNKEEPPVRIRSVGGLYVFSSSQQETPNVQTSIFEYGDGSVLEFATRGLDTNAEGEVKIGNIFYGSEGRLEIQEDGNWKTFLGRKSEPGPNSSSIDEEKSDAMNPVGTGISGHFNNFVEAVMARDPRKLNCEIEVGYRSSILPHLANISYRLKREVSWDAHKEQFTGDADANGMLRRHDRKGFEVPSIAAPKVG